MSSLLITCVFLCIVFLLNQPIGMFELPNCSCHGWITNLQHCDWLIARKYNTHVMSKNSHSYIKLNKNIDNELIIIISDDISNHSLLQGVQKKYPLLKSDLLL